MVLLDMALFGHCLLATPFGSESSLPPTKYEPLPEQRGNPHNFVATAACVDCYFIARIENIALRPKAKIVLAVVLWLKFHFCLQPFGGKFGQLMGD